MREFMKRFVKISDSTYEWTISKDYHYELKYKIFPTLP